MSTVDPAGTRAGARRGAADGNGIGAPARRRRSTETKAAFKTTVAYVAAVVAVLIAGMVLDQNDSGGLGARQVWLYVTI